MGPQRLTCLSTTTSRTQCNGTTTASALGSSLVTPFPATSQAAPRSWRAGASLKRHGPPLAAIHSNSSTVIPPSSIWRCGICASLQSKCVVPDLVWALSLAATGRAGHGAAQMLPARIRAVLNELVLPLVKSSSATTAALSMMLVRYSCSSLTLTASSLLLHSVGSILCQDLSDVVMVAHEYCLAVEAWNFQWNRHLTIEVPARDNHAPALQCLSRPFEAERGLC